MKRVIYSGMLDNESRFIVDHLNKVNNWKPVFFLVHDAIVTQLKTSYPEAVQAQSMKLRKGYFDYSDIGEPEPIDAEILEALSKYQSNMLSWLEDTTGWNFSYFERRRYSYNILKYWNAVIKKMKPDIFIADSWPHTESDYPLYLLCKYYYNIPVLFVDFVPHFNQHYYNVATSIENLSEPFLKYYKSDSSREISDVVKEYLEKIRANNPESPEHIKKAYHRFNMMRKSNFQNYINIFKLLITFRAFNQSVRAFKKNKMPWGSKLSQLTHFGYFMFKEKLRVKNKKLKKIYDAISTQPSFSEKFIYLPAPYQPEANSNLSPGVYEDHFLVLEILSKAIPDNWMLYYKEHPGIFEPMLKGGLARDEEYYKKLKAMEKVQILPCSVDTFSLIDNSQAVATIGGTAGWEALIRGKPVLVFGSSVYQGCDSVFAITTCKDAVDAIDKIIDGYIPDSKDVERYAQSIFLASHKDLLSVIEYGERLSKCSDPKHEMERIAEAFVEAYGRLY